MAVNKKSDKMFTMHFMLQRTVNIIILIMKINKIKYNCKLLFLIRNMNGFDLNMFTFLGNIEHNDKSKKNTFI